MDEHSAVYIDGCTGDKRGEVRGQEQKMFPISVGLAIRPIGMVLRILSKIS